MWRLAYQCNRHYVYDLPWKNKIFTILKFPNCIEHCPHENLEGHIWHSFVFDDIISIFLKECMHCTIFKLQDTIHNHEHFTYLLLHTWHAIVILSFKRFTWSNIIHDFSMSLQSASSLQHVHHYLGLLAFKNKCFVIQSWNLLSWTNLKRNGICAQQYYISYIFHYVRNTLTPRTN